MDTTTLICATCSAVFNQPSSSVRYRLARGQTSFFCSRRCYEIDKSGDKADRVARYREVVRDGKRIFEHRWVVEQALGRPLGPDEIVHHINGDSLDNRLKNLRVMDRGSHSREHFLLPLPIERLKSLRKAGWTLTQLAEEFGCGRTTISNRLAELGFGTFRTSRSGRSFPLT